MSIQNNIEDYIREEEKCFMQKQAGKTISDLATELGISMERAGGCSMELLKEKLSTKFVAELMEKPLFQSLIIPSYFMDMHGEWEAFGLKLLWKSEPCRHCGAVDEVWYALCINGNGAKFDEICCTNYEHRPDSPYDGCTIASSVKPLMEEHGFLD